MDTRLDQLLEELESRMGREEATILINELIRDRRIKLAKKDPNEFIKYCAISDDAEEFYQAPFHEEVQKFIPFADRKKVGGWRGMICLPRNHGKSTQLTYRDVWEIGNDPSIRIKVVTATTTLASKIVGNIKTMIESNDRVKEVFPSLRPSKPWADMNLRVKGARIGEKEVTVEGTSITSGGAGGRADLIHFDDVCDYENSVAKPALRDKIIDTFDSTWINLLEPWGRAVYAYTPWDSKDLSAFLSAKDAWHKIIRPCYTLDSKGGWIPLWPEKWSEEAIRERMIELGARTFARQFMLKAISDEEMVFDETVLRPCLRPEWVYKSPEYEEFVRDMPKVMGVDLGASLSDKASYTVFMTAAMDQHGRLWVVDLHRGRWKAHEVHSILYNKWKHYNHQYIVVENNAYQRSVIDHLCHSSINDAYKIPLAGMTTTGIMKRSEEVGIRGLSVSMSHGTWQIPVGHLIDGALPFSVEEPTCMLAWPQSLVDRDPIAVFIREMLEWKSVESSAYTDTVMAAWFTTWAGGAGITLNDVLKAAGQAS